MVHNHEFKDTYKVPSKYLLSYTIESDLWKPEQIKSLKEKFRKTTYDFDDLDFGKIISMIYDELKEDNIHHLEIKLEDYQKCEKSFCSILNGNIEYYNKLKKIGDKDKEIFVTYRKYLEVKYINHNGSPVHTKAMRKLVDDFSRNASRELNSIMLKSLTTKEKKLCQFYSIFYNRNIDFSRKYTPIEIHAMLYLLEKYGIEFIGNHSMKSESELALPMIDKLILLEKIEEVDNPVDLSYSEVMKAKSIGQVVKKYMKASKNKQSFLETTCITLENDMDGTESELSEKLDCPYEEVYAVYKMVNTINQNNNGSR